MKTKTPYSVDCLINKIKNDFPISARLMNYRHRKEPVQLVRCSKSKFFQTDFSFCEYPIKNISKIIIVK